MTLQAFRGAVTESEPDSNVMLEQELEAVTGRVIGRHRFGSSLHFRNRNGLLAH